jgi:hypothetical protein
MAICLFVLPIITPGAKFMDSQFIDVLARCILWFWLVFAYWSLSTALTNQVEGSGRFFLAMEKNTSSFVMLVVSAIGLGLGVGLLTRWGLLVFAPGLMDAAVFLIAVLNGFIYAVLVFSRYLWLTEPK